MIVALHEAPKGFFKASPPHGNDELLRLVRKTASLGFKAAEIGPLASYVPIDGERLRKALDRLRMKRSVHVGGLFDATKFATTEEEHSHMERQIERGVALCNEIRSTLMSIHPPYFEKGSKPSEELQLKAKSRFLELLKKEIDYASHHKIKVALESFCYKPFIFEDIDDFGQFVSKFSLEKLGVLLDVGHLYQAGISLSEAVRILRDRLLDVHIHDATLDKDYRRATHLPIGKGTINFPSLMSLLREACYDGWLTLEIRASEEEIRQSREYLEDLIAKT